MAGVNGGAADTIFGLPPGIFGPLSAPPRRDYARVLHHVYRGHLSSNTMDGLDLRRGDVIGFLSNAIASLPAAEEGSAPEASNMRITNDPHLVYRHLVDAGWFIERTVGSETLVVVSRPVMDLFRALDGIARGSSVNFTGSLQTIEVALKALEEDPSGRAMMLAVAAQQAEEFSGRMMAVSADIRANESLITSRSGFGDMIAAFFDDFVAHLVSDYKAMKSLYNPLRHAASIMSVCNAYADDDAIIAALARGYVVCGYARDEAVGLAAVRAHLITVSEIFSRAQSAVEDIDAVRLRVEERVARAVRFVDAAAAAESSEIEEVTALLARVADVAGSLDGMPDSMLLIDDYPIDPDSMANPRRRSNPVGAVGVEAPEHDEELAELARVRIRYAEEMIPTPESIEAYVERHLGTAASMPLADFVVDAPREMLLLAAVRSVAANPDAAVRERYGVSFSGGYVDGVWSEYRDGLVYRIGSEADPEMKPGDGVSVNADDAMQASSAVQEGVPA